MVSFRLKCVVGVVVAVLVLSLRHAGVLPGPVWLWVVAFELPVLLWVAVSAGVPIVREVRGRPADSRALPVLEGAVLQRFPRFFAQAIMMDVKALRAVWGVSVERFARRLSSGGMSGDVGVGHRVVCRYDQQLFWPFVVVAVVDGLVAVLIHVALEPGVVRAVLDVLGVVGLLWVCGFLASLRFYRHEFSGRDCCLHFAQLGTFLVEAAPVSVSKNLLSVESNNAAVICERSVSDGKREKDGEAAGTLLLPVFGNVNVLVELDRPVVVRSGVRNVGGRVVDRVHLWVDDPDVMVEDLAETVF